VTAAARPYDLDLLLRQLLEAGTVAPVNRVQPVLDHSQ